MKKMFSWLCVLALMVSVLAGCAPEKSPATEPSVETTEAVTKATTEAVSETTTEATEEPVQAVEVRAAALKGPTAIGLAYFMDQAEGYTDNHYSFSMAASPDELVPQLLAGELDMAAIPANLSAVLYQKSQAGVQVLGINTLGVLNLLEKGDTVHSVADLQGRTLYATGKNHTPEQVLTYLLAQNDMVIGEDVTVEWKSEATECLNALLTEENAIAMLPQPFASAAQLKDEAIRVALDLTQEWDKVNPESTLVTGVVVARKEFVEQHPEAVSAFMDHYKESIDYMNANVEDGAKLVAQLDIVKEPVAKKAIPNCNLVFIEGAEMQAKLSGYLQVLFDQNPKSVGGQLPGEDFYFAR